MNYRITLEICLQQASPNTRYPVKRLFTVENQYLTRIRPAHWLHNGDRGEWTRLGRHCQVGGASLPTEKDESFQMDIWSGGAVGSPL